MPDGFPSVPYADGLGGYPGGPAATVTPSGADSLSPLVFSDILARVRELEAQSGFLPDWFLASLSGRTIIASDRSFALLGAWSPSPLSPIGLSVSSDFAYTRCVS